MIDQAFNMVKDLSLLLLFFGVYSIFGESLYGNKLTKNKYANAILWCLRFFPAVVLSQIVLILICGIGLSAAKEYLHLIQSQLYAIAILAPIFAIVSNLIGLFIAWISTDVHTEIFRRLKSELSESANFPTVENPGYLAGIFDESDYRLKKAIMNKVFRLVFFGLLATTLTMPESYISISKSILSP